MARSTKTCTVPGCDKPLRARGYCQPHWLRWWRHGDPLAGGVMRDGRTRKFAAELVRTLDTNDCFAWPFAKNGSYGGITVDGQTHNAHAYICHLAHGPKPTPRHEAAHNCGTPICCNPRHIRWATPSENNQDKKMHGTHNAGEKSPMCVISDDTIDQIRHLTRTTKMTFTAIGEMFGVSNGYVSEIARDLCRPLRTEDVTPAYIEQADPELLAWLTVGDVVRSVERKGVVA